MMGKNYIVLTTEILHYRACNEIKACETSIGYQSLFMSHSYDFKTVFNRSGHKFDQGRKCHIMYAISYLPYNKEDNKYILNT